MKLICIGNSIVNGFPYEKKKSFPSLLMDRTNWNVVNKGINGQNTNETLARFDKDVINENPDAVLILTAANDFIFNINTPREAMENIKIMAKKAYNSNINLFLATPLLTDAVQASMCWMPDMHINYRKVNQQLSEFADLIRLYCTKNNTNLVEMQKEYEKFSSYKDGVHPVPSGYSLLADIVKKSLIQGGTNAK